MLDQATLDGRIVTAALLLAAERPWREVTLLDIAEAAQVTLAEMRRHFSGKGDILAAFARSIDDEVLARQRARTSNTAARDALFEVVMERFDALAPHKPALRSIAEGGGGDLGLLKALLDSQAWMLNAAGIATDGATGPVKVLGLASVYSSVFRTWLDDDDPGLARTMAALDRKLRRGERTMQTVDEVFQGIDRLAGVLRGRTWRQASSTSAAGSETTSSQSPPST